MNQRFSRGQFDISTVLSWMAVIALHLTLIDWNHINSDEFFLSALFWLLLMFPASSCIPMLIRHCRDEKGHQFHGMDRFRLAGLVAVYSLLMIMLATSAFRPTWKGSKGMHWGYYLLDGWAGTTLWPIYGLGVVVLVRGIFDKTDRAVRSPWCLIHSLTLAVISFGYVYACFFLDFAKGARTTWIVPASVAICYGLLSVTYYKNRQFEAPFLRYSPRLWGWLSGLVVSLFAKCPLAWWSYESLPDEPPNCFVVTAAAQGHPRIVRSWYDPARGKWVNRQLETFWRFEELLSRNLPTCHRQLRRTYNTAGPLVARRIQNRFAADGVYWLLKPLEWSVQILLCLRSRQNKTG